MSDLFAFLEEAPSPEPPRSLTKVGTCLPCYVGSCGSCSEQAGSLIGCICPHTLNTPTTGESP